MEDSQSQIQNKADNTNFSIKEKEGQEVYICNICQKEAKSAKAVKHHITSKHRERPTDSDDDDPEGKKSKDEIDEVDDIDDDELAAWATMEKGSEASIQKEGEAPPPSQQPMETNSTEERMVINSENEAEGNLLDAVERIKHLENESKTKEELIKNLELQIDTKSDLLNLANVKADSLEMEMVDKETRNKQLAAAYKNMKIKLNEGNGGGANPEITKKLKKATDDLKAKSKLLEESEKAKEELNIKVGKEIALRAKAEADNVMLQGCVKALQSVVDSKTTTKESTKDQERCSFLDKPGGCKKGDRCRFMHPEKEAPRAGKQDCSFWMAGSCKFSDEECTKSHDPTKKGSKGKKRDELTAFAESLAQVPSQAQMAGAHMGSTQGMEAQRWSTQGMGGQNNFLARQGPPPPFQNMTPHLMTPPFPLAEIPSDPTQLGQLVLQVLQRDQAGRR